MRLAGTANATAPRACAAGAAATKRAPATHETTKATACSTPRSVGGCGRDGSDPAASLIRDKPSSGRRTGSAANEVTSPCWRARRLPRRASSLERRSQLAADEDADRAVAEVEDELAVAPPEGAPELVRSDDEAVLTRADVEEQRLDGGVVGAKQHLLQARVELASVEPPRDDPGDERSLVGAREQDEHRAADQAQQRLQHLLVAELCGSLRLAVFEPCHSASPASASAASVGVASALRRATARASFFACFSSRFSRNACSRARLSTDCGLRRAISDSPATAPTAPRPMAHL